MGRFRLVAPPQPRSLASGSRSSAATVWSAPDGVGRFGRLAPPPGIRSPPVSLVPGRYRNHLRSRQDSRHTLLAAALSSGLAALGAGPSRADALLRDQSVRRRGPLVARLLRAVYAAFGAASTAADRLPGVLLCRSLDARRRPTGAKRTVAAPGSIARRVGACRGPVGRPAGSRHREPDPGSAGGDALPRLAAVGSSGDRSGAASGRRHGGDVALRSGAVAD